MDIQTRIKTMMVEAMKAKDELRLNTVRGIKSALKYAEIEKIGTLTDAEIAQTIKKMVKQRQDSIEQFEKANRQELADKEKKEMAILEEFLPQQMAEGEVAALITAAQTELGATTLKDMGKVIKAVMEKAEGRADGRMVSELVKKKLGG